MGSSCGACKFLRRKCTSECVFAPYFSHDQAASHFAAVHKVFGASNFSKLLLHLPVGSRSDAAFTISYEALARMRDPINGCVADIFILQQQVANLQKEIEMLGNQVAYMTVGISSRRSIQSITNPSDKLQCPLQHNVLDTFYYLNQPTAMPNHTGYTTGNLVFSNDINAEILPLTPQEDINSLCDNNLNTFERLFEGVAMPQARNVQAASNINLHMNSELEQYQNLLGFI